MRLHTCGKLPFCEGHCLGIHDVAYPLPFVRMFEARNNFQKWIGAHKIYKLTCGLQREVSSTPPSCDVSINCLSKQFGITNSVCSNPDCEVGAHEHQLRRKSFVKSRAETAGLITHVLRASIGLLDV